MATRRETLWGLLAGALTGPAAAGTAASDAPAPEARVAEAPRLRTRADIAAHGFAPSVQVVRTEGFARAGDGGGGLYERASLEPAHAGKVRSADGAWWELISERVSVKQLGARGDGATDDTEALHAAIALVEARGGGSLHLPAGRYVVSAPLTVTGDHVHLEGEGQGRTILTKRSSTKFLIAEGSWTTDEGNMLAADARQGTTTLTLVPGAGANIPSDGWVVLVSEGPIPGGRNVINKRAEFVHVHVAAGDELLLSSPIRYDYLTDDLAEVRRVSWLEGLRISGIGFDGNGHIEGDNPNADNVLELDWCLGPVIEDCGAWELPNVFVKLENCLNARLTGIRARDMLSQGIVGDDNNYGYAIIELSLNEGLVADSIHAERVRHAYTTAANRVQYGVPTGSRITNGVAVRCRGSGWDTHPVGANISFVNCVVLGSLGHGFQLRSIGATITGCSARDCLGSGVNISLDALRCRVSAFDAHQTNLGTFGGLAWQDRGAIYDDGIETVVDGATVTHCGGPVLEAARNGDGGRYQNIVGRDPCRLTKKAPRGFLADSDGPERFTLYNVDISDTAGNMADGYFLTAETLSDVRLIHCHARGFARDHFAIRSGPGVQVFPAAGVHAGAIGNRQPRRIEGGVINVEAAGSAFIALETGGTGAELVTIEGAEEGTRITLTYGDGPVAIRHGVDNIFLNGSLDAVLSEARDNLNLIRIGGAWAETGRGIA